MGATVYYQDDNISVSDEQVRVGEHTFPPSVIDAYEARTRILGLHSRWQYLLVWGLLALCILGVGATFVRSVQSTFRGVSEPESVYAQDWLDFILPVSFFLLSCFLLFIFRGPSVGIALKLKSGAAPVGSIVIWLAPGTNKGVAVNVATLLDALHKVAPHARLISGGKTVEFHDSPPPQDALYWDGTTAVTNDYMRYKEHTLPVADITQVRVALGNSDSPLWVLNGFNALFLSAIFGFQFLTNPPVMLDGVTMFPRQWLFALAMLCLVPVIISSTLRAFRDRKNSTVYTVTVHGRFNRDVILPMDILVTSDEEHAQQVRVAIEQVIGRHMQHRGTNYVRRVPAIGQPTA